MKIARIILAGSAALTIVFSPALAQQTLTGRITKLDRINGTIAIQKTQDGTVGANTSSGSEEYKVGDGVSLDKWHAGDRVSFSTKEAGGTTTITKLDKP